MSGRTPLVMLREYTHLLKELRDAKVTRSVNNPVADYTEQLVARALNLTLATKSTAGFDATDAHGHRYEIKGRRLTPENASRQLSVFRGLAQNKFDFLAGVIFDVDFVVSRACLLSHGVVVELSSYRSHVSANILHLRDSVWLHPAVQDITRLVRTAQEALEAEAV